MTPALRYKIAVRVYEAIEQADRTDDVTCAKQAADAIISFIAESADRIPTLEAENARMREAL